MLVVAWSAGLSLFLGPTLIDWLETLRGVPLRYELAVRIYILIALALSLKAWLALILLRLTTKRLILWMFVAAGSAVIAAVCVADRYHLLVSEDHWIRYTTAVMLFLTGVAAAFVARWYHINGGPVRRLRWLWGLMALAFAGLACDEVLVLHEKLGRIFVQNFHMPPYFSDLITLMYAVAGLIFVIIFFRAFFNEYVPRHNTFVTLFILGVLAFGVSQIFDTFDQTIKVWLVDLGVRRSADPGLLFSDFWYPLWSPRRILNSIEEVLENLACLLFFSGVLMLLFEKHRPNINVKDMAPYPRAGLVLITAMAIGSVVVVIWTGKNYHIESPAVGRSAKAILRASDGLYHTDMLFSRPQWGVIVANEGRGNVVVFKEGRIRVLPDPAGLVKDTDSVTATDSAIYASSPSLNTVFRYTEEEGWVPFLTESDGILAPEGLVVVDSTMYILDETNHRMYAADLETRKVAALEIEDGRWDNPEGIAYHPQLGELLITDDKSGYIVAFKYGGQARVFASPETGLKSPEDIAVAVDGRVFVADSGRREVIEFTHNGEVVDRIKFHRMYGDIVGVTTVKDGNRENLYVTSSDGYGSTSFMPSAVWELVLSTKQVKDPSSAETRSN